MGQLFSNTPNDEDNGNLESSFTKYFRKYKPETKIISEENIRSIELRLKKGDIQGANSVISDILKNIDNAPINIAVTGESGAGKSSLINTLREIEHEEEGAAKVGVTETTTEAVSYKHPKVKNLTLWDLPGIGTMKFQPKDYLEKVEFKKYDFFIIASSTRFTKHELDLAKAIRIMKKNYYFVRTKVDVDLENEEKCHPRTFNRETTLEDIQNYCLDGFKNNKIEEPKVFLISNHSLSDYDFPLLMDTLIKDLPAEKRHNFLLSLPNITEAAIQKKYNSTKQFIWLDAMKDGLLATVPVVGILKDLDMDRLKNILNHYRDLFGVDDESLMAMAKDSQVSVELLKKKLKSPYLLELKEETLGGMLLNCLEKFASANGGLLATGLYFRKTYYLQFHFLDTVAEDAKVLLKEAYSKK
ncbi:interferon-inducible GTPase 1-like [Apodemus sylvaticus]|uniref:interferon-inducible GTPase 1-like n=1 Tax=Apodemus sylvaticus TaxID=10129 RepID=UPI002243176B|nr:interferon-inducible GTPase 1-like [Apodemus sylvaticus]XP_052011913.1 interferon-inducible GTPase 1-like [Apodemus sylvaticus]XP_052011914.1 interferon-inducible GTPase 1-like [Apodemus sylvaticus]